MNALFWALVLIVFYVYAGYPLSIFLLSLARGKKITKREFYPDVSLVISAYNEERHIAAKLETIGQLDYPRDKLEILVGSDGSTDKTEEIVSRYSGAGVRLYAVSPRQGKPAMLNRLVPLAKGEIIVFTDARQRLDKDSLKELTANFADEKVGSVSAELVFENEDSQPARGIGLYWRYEKFIRGCESRLDSMLGATGAMYAIRKELFPGLPRDLILDDMYIPLQIVRKGCRAVFEPRARIFDRMAADGREEFSRKARTLAGNFQLFVYLKEMFNPFRSAVAWQLWSHKFLRLMVPFLLILIFAVNLLILGNVFYRWTLAAQLIFYLLAAGKYLLKINSRFLEAPYMFCLMNAAAVAGLYRFLANKQRVTWQKN
ncbi:MAG: glycosyltransferase family 2 protein [Candidatus Omnitrophota bacterium]